MSEILWATQQAYAIQEMITTDWETFLAEGDKSFHNILSGANLNPGATKTSHEGQFSFINTRIFLKFTSFYEAEIFKFYIHLTSESLQYLSDDSVWFYVISMWPTGYDMAMTFSPDEEGAYDAIPVAWLPGPIEATDDDGYPFYIFTTSIPIDGELILMLDRNISTGQHLVEPNYNTEYEIPNAILTRWFGANYDEIIPAWWIEIQPHITGVGSATIGNLYTTAYKTNNKHGAL